MRQLAQAVFLFNCGMVGVTAASALATFAQLSPFTFKLAMVIFAALMIVWVLAWVLDDPIIERLKIHPDHYHTILVVIGVVVTLGAIRSIWLIR